MGTPDNRKTFEDEGGAFELDRGYRRAPLGLTIAWHPDVDRVGEVARLRHGRTVLSRYDVDFHSIDGGRGRCLDTHMVTRKPLFIDVGDSTVRIEPPSGRAPYVDGVRLSAPRTWSREQIEERMLLIDIGHRLLLALHPLPDVPAAMDRHDMIGDSASIRRLRLDIDKAARSDRTVLVRGETGSGKELVAAGIHLASRRRDEPYMAINCGQLDPGRIASTLFGHRRGAFTGAFADHAGAFRTTHRGTLFLDEIGELDMASQAALLRTLDEGEVMALGATRPERVDTRVIAATDADLPAKIADGSFRGPLYFRLHNVAIDVPPLRDRPDDIPRLFVHQLRKELGRLDALDRLDRGREDGRPWINARWIAHMMHYSWPGNVRELLALAGKLADAGDDLDRLEAVGRFDWLKRRSSDPSTLGATSTRRTGDTARQTAGVPTNGRSHSVPVSRSLAEGGIDPVSIEPRHSRRSRSETGPMPPVDPGPRGPDPRLLSGSGGIRYTPAGVQRMLGHNGWSVHRTARQIGVPKTSLMRYAEQELDIVPVSKLPEAVLREHYDAVQGRLSDLSERLRVTTRALRQRLRELGWPFSD